MTAIEEELYNALMLAFMFPSRDKWVSLQYTLARYPERARATALWVSVLRGRRSGWWFVSLAYMPSVYLPSDNPSAVLVSCHLGQDDRVCGESSPGTCCKRCLLSELVMASSRSKAVVLFDPV